VHISSNDIQLEHEKQLDVKETGIKGSSLVALEYLSKIKTT